jgi:hypothetical protein
MFRELTKSASETLHFLSYFFSDGPQHVLETQLIFELPAAGGQSSKHISPSFSRKGPKVIWD